jgi:hypothetical protein
LDRLFFGDRKVHPPAIDPDCDDLSPHYQAIKMVQAYEKTAISFNIRESFRKAGLLPTLI